METRDKLNNIENYKQILRFNEEDNKYLLQDIESLKEDGKKGVQKHKLSNAEVIKNTYDFISKNCYEVFKVSYSLGLPLFKVREHFLEYLEIKHLVLNSHIHYLDDLDIVSVGILLDIDRETMAPFIDNIKRVNYQDYLMDFLVRHYRSDWRQHETIKFKRPYAHTKPIIEAKDKADALKHLKDYVSRQWYPESNEAPWYNSHKAKNPAFHAGYWSFESAAIAKRLGLDDSSLKGKAYYPYDMVHWKGE